MKKIVLIIAITTIPLITLVGGLYLFSIIKQGDIIDQMIDSIEDPYYQELARQCGEKNEMELQCCLDSVSNMIDLGAKLYTEDECACEQFGSLYCLGAYKWCVPMTSATSASIGKYESKYQLLEGKCINKSRDDGREDCLEAVTMMRKNNYEPAPCAEEDYPDGFIVNGFDCIGCEDVNWCESKDGRNKAEDNKSCIVDEDCVPVACCHAAEVVNKEFAPNCDNKMCTMSCETVLDCGRGKPVCNDGVCEIEIK